MGKKTLAVLHETEVRDLSAITGIDQGEIRDKFGQFVRLHPSGRINKKDMKIIMADNVPLPTRDVRRIRNHIFRIFDENNDGYINFVEFMKVHHIMVEGSTDEILAKVFRVFDVNNDGTISKKELKRLVGDIIGLILAGGEKNMQTEEIFNGKNVLDVIVNGALAEMDKEHTGKIEAEDFIAACKAGCVFTKLLVLSIMEIFDDTSVHGNDTEQNVYNMSKSENLNNKENDKVSQNQDTITKETSNKVDTFHVVELNEATKDKASEDPGTMVKERISDNNNNISQDWNTKTEGISKLVNISQHFSHICLRLHTT